MSFRRILQKITVTKVTIMFVLAVKKMSNAMFPIFRRETLSPHEVRLASSGTGFFIGNNGEFVSVAHIFENPTPQSSFLYYGLLPNNLESPALEIIEVARDEEHDIFIGRVNKTTPNFLTLSEEMVDVGKTICIGGYPLPQITLNAGGGFELGGVRRYFQPSFVLDHMIVNTAGNTPRTHDGFLIRDVGLFGMSGGPIVDLEGTVIGMQAAVTSPRESTNGAGRTIVVENAIAVRSNLIVEFITQQGLTYGKTI